MSTITSSSQAIRRPLRGPGTGWSGNADATGGILEFAGVNTSTPVDVSGYTYCPSQGGTGCTMPWTTATAPAVTTTKANDEIVAFFASGGSQNFNTGDTYGGEDGATKQYSATSSNNTGGQGANYESDAAGVATTSVQTSAGSTGTFTLTLGSPNSTPFSWIASTIALEP